MNISLFPACVFYRREKSFLCGFQIVKRKILYEFCLFDRAVFRRENSQAAVSEINIKRIHDLS